MNPSVSLNYYELEQYLLIRRKYRLIFEKREFWKEMESSDLNAFFVDCGCAPSTIDIEEALEIFIKSRSIIGGRAKKRSETGLLFEDVLEIAFYLYPPSRTWVTNES
jgi:hypothetical protein